MAMANVIFKFFQVNVPDEEVEPFLGQIEKISREFAGDAYHFRYELEQSFPGTITRNPRAKPNGANKQPKFKPV